MHSPSEVNRTVMRDTLVFALILAGGFLTRFPSILNIGFISDESVYDYAAYAIGRGITPYVQIMLPHPPLGYLALVAPVILEQGNLLFLRTFNLVTYLIDAAIAFWIFRILYQQSKRSFHPMLAFALFTLYPLPFSTTTPIEFTLFDVPILLGTVLFVKGLTQNSPVHLLIAGALFGVALMIWFTALFFAFSIVSFLVVHRPPKGADRFRVFVKQAVTIVVGGVVVIGTVLGLIIAWGALPNFLVQSVSLQTSLRASFTFGERLHHIVLAILQLLPLLLAASVGTFVLARRVKLGANPLVILPSWIVVINLALVFTVPRIVLNHYIAYLMPFIVFLAAGPVEKTVRWIIQIPQKLAKPIPWDLIQSGLTITLIISAFATYSYQSGFLSNSAYTLADQTVGRFVANITGPKDSIWTSEGSIAYFASRLIQAPDSIHWPFQAEYNDIFNASYVDSDGITQKGFGAVSPMDFQSAWQSDHTKVLVFILGNGPVPYPDDFLWNGFQDTRGVYIAGVMTWVNSNYVLKGNFTFPNVEYTYSVWLKQSS